MKLLAALLLSVLPCSAFAQLANHPPVPVWLEGALSYTREFPQDSSLLMGILLIAADREVQITVNGTSLSAPAKVTEALSLDLTRWLRSGANTISLGSTDAKPFRAAVLLELNGDLTSKRWIASDTGWQASPGPLRTGGPAQEAFDLKKTFDAYNSWQLAKRERQAESTDPASLTLPPGFHAERIRSAQPDEDSWVAMAFDPQGRITLAREKRGLLRFDPAKGSMETLDDSLLECRGLLYAHGGLYAHANNSKALYRLDPPAPPRELLRTAGGVGHGRNHLKLDPGPGGELWVINGNNVLLPKPLAPTSPFRLYAPDQVLPNPWDGSMFDGNVELPAGHVLRIGHEGAPVELFAGGLRNALDLAFHRDGELFTFDADMERDVGAPWYMPTRILHVVSGADFGWRRGTGRFPDWYADTLPSVVEVGLASPTAVFFGYGARMPARYQEALFVCDWSYGRILAVHLNPDGASYRGSVEPFLSGRPLNVTDGCIGPDGALWLITGGRGTLSGLYRIHYSGNVAPPPLPQAPHPFLELRRQLESAHRAPSPDRMPLILANLGHEDRFIRHAARVALERLPAELWQEQVLDTADPWRILNGSLALARLHETPDEALFRLPWGDLTEEQRLAALRILGIGLARRGDPDERRRVTWLAWLEPLYPTLSVALNQELCRLLVRLKSDVVLARSLPLLREATTSEDLLFYPLNLRSLTSGWDLESRRLIFDSLTQAETFPGASSYFKAIQDLRAEYAAACPPDQATALAAMIHPSKPVALSPHALPGHSFRSWTLAELAPKLDQVSRGRSFASGRRAVVSAQCVFCHRVTASSGLPAGVFGPDLLQVSARFGRRDLLAHILDPSLFIDEKYRYVSLTMADGQTLLGSLESEDDERIVLKPNPLLPDVIEAGKSQILRQEISELSPMPKDLLNALKLDEILDLLAFLETGGNPEAPNFQD